MTDQEKARKALEDFETLFDMGISEDERLAPGFFLTTHGKTIREVLQAAAEPKPSAGEVGDMGLRYFLSKNIERQKYWKSEEWDMPRWITALTGEIGEAANVVKKTFRGDMSEDEARPKLASEFADILTYLVIAADKAGIDLVDATIQKFNEVSDRATVKSPVKIHAAQSAQVEEVSVEEFLRVAWSKVTYDMNPIQAVRQAAETISKEFQHGLRIIREKGE